MSISHIHVLLLSLAISFILFSWRCRRGLPSWCLSSLITLPELGPSVPEPPRPVVLYPLNSKFGGNELRNRNNPAILVGVRPGVGPSRRPGEAYEFRGNPGSFIKIPNAGRMDTVKAITVVVSVLPKSRQGPIFQFSDKGYGLRLWMVRRDMVMAEFVTRSPRIKMPYLASIKIKPWKWNVVGMSYTKKTGVATLYVNNVAVVRKKLGRFDLATNYPVIMGAKPGDKRVFRGSVSCLQIFNDALNTDQITVAGQACFKKGKFGAFSRCFDCDKSEEGNESTEVVLANTVRKWTRNLRTKIRKMRTNDSK